MRIAIITALDNGVGLERDYRILRALAESAGHEVHGLHFRRSKPAARFDLAIFLEVYNLGWHDLAPRRWMVPNPEWWMPQWSAALPAFERVLCKTRDAERIFAGLGARAEYVGFEATDRLDSRVGRERRFLHIAGESLLKGTAAIVEAWERYDIHEPLTIVARKMKVRSRSRFVAVRTRMADRDLRHLQNRCLFALQPSEYEGYGHVLHEALSVGALLATTDAPPMEDVPEALYIPPAAHGTHGLATTTRVDAAGVRDAVEVMLAMDEAAVIAGRQAARAAFERETADFRAALAARW